MGKFQIHGFLSSVRLIGQGRHSHRMIAMVFHLFSQILAVNTSLRGCVKQNSHLKLSQRHFMMLVEIAKICGCNLAL